MPGVTEGAGHRYAGVVGGLLAAALLAGCGSPTETAAQPSSRGTVSVATTPATGKASAPPTKPVALARSVPVRLEIPSIGVDTPVIRLGLQADGSVQVPPIEAHAPAGWYQGSPTPGQLGPSVLLAHVTVGAYGDGVFVHLARLKPGDRITARLADGASAVFAVDRVRAYAKADFPTKAVYGDVDRPELRLITCGGPRNSDGSGYLDNVVVFASLVPGASGPGGAR